jgi:hypothetical protein
MPRFLRAAALAALAFALATAPALAQNYPNRPIRIIVPYGAGSAPDVIARTAAEELSSRLGQPVVVDNRLGAGGKIGTEIAARAGADGYTLLLGSKDTHGVMQHLYPGWDVDPVKDFAPISSSSHPERDRGQSHDQGSRHEGADRARQGGEPQLRHARRGTNLHLLAETLQLTYGLEADARAVQNSEISPAAVLATEPRRARRASLAFVRGRLKALGVTGGALAFLPTSRPSRAGVQVRTRRLVRPVRRPARRTPCNA